MQTRTDSRQTGGIFLLAGGLVLAHQVAGKAVRDGLFLSQFSPGDLPKVVALAALLAVLLGMGFGRLLSRYGPTRLVPRAFALGSLLHLAEFALLRTTEGPARAAAVTLVYLHLVGFGSILLSGFWRLANEVFDPRLAKRLFGRIAGAGTVGGICGGLLAERGAALFGAESLLVLLAMLHLATWLVLRQSAEMQDSPGPTSDDRDPWESARAAFRQAPFLANLAVLVLLGTVSANLLDYLFKSGAAAAYGKGSELTRYFALFYTGSQLLTFLVQTVLTPLALRHLGLGRTMQWHSTAIAFGAGASLFLPALVMAPVARALELIFRGSFFRSSYELFFTPAPPREKRATKTFIDVSCDRMGDALGAGVLQLLLLAGAKQAVTPILLVTGTLALTAFWITRRMDAAYSRVLEHGLLTRAVALNQADVRDSTSLAVLSQITTASSARTTPPAPALEVQTGLPDRLLMRMADLRSGAALRVQAALAPDQPYDPAVVPLAIKLLAWGESYEWARAFLLRHAHRVVGQLVDALLDAEEDFAVRRRIPQILAYTSSQRAADGLTSALDDSRFEVRFNAGRAIEFLHRMSGGLHFDHVALLSAVERELSTSPSIWQARKLLDDRAPADAQYWFLDEVLCDRADKSLEYVFSLLAVRLSPGPLKIAFRALHSQDRMLRGLALEFLESHLSVHLVSQMRRLVAPATPTMAARNPEQVLSDLLASETNLRIAAEPA